MWIVHIVKSFIFVNLISMEYFLNHLPLLLNNLTDEINLTSSVTFSRFTSSFFVISIARIICCCIKAIVTGWTSKTLKLRCQFVANISVLWSFYAILRVTRLAGLEVCITPQLLHAFVVWRAVQRSVLLHPPPPPLTLSSYHANKKLTCIGAVFLIALKRRLWKFY